MARRKKTLSEQAAQPPEPETIEKPRRRRKKAETASVTEPVEQAAIEMTGQEPSLREVIPEPVPVVSPPEEGTAADSPPPTVMPEQAEETVERAAPRRRKRKTEPSEPSELSDLSAEPLLAEPAVPLETPAAITIRHPEARVHFHRGVPSLTFGERVVRPTLFFGNPHTPEASMRVHQQMQLASEAGISLFALLVALPVRATGAIEAFDTIRYWSALARELNPDALLLWRVVPTPVGNWQQEFPEAVVRYADGTVGGPSVCADRWWDLVRSQLVELVALVEQEEEGGSTIGYHLDWGEWFLAESGGYDTSEAALQAFRDWLRRHFRNDTVSLRVSWFNGEVSFSTVSIPPFIPNAPLTKRQFYDPRREGRWINYHQFIADATARRILGLARAVKEACQRRCLVGASYGYVLEWRHPYSGHLTLGALLQSEDIDFLSAPITYADRLPGGTGALPVPLESLHLHHKLFIAEEDYRTPFGKVARLDQPATEHSLTPSAGVEEDYNPLLRSAEAVEQVQTRSLAQAVVHGFGQAWMDLWGEGWLQHPPLWERIAQMQPLWRLREQVGQTEPDLAVVIDPMSLSYVRTGSPLIQQVVVQARDAVMRSGIAYGFYLLEDVARRGFPRSRMVLFLNAWNLKPSIREAIRRRLQRDGRVLIWLYAASLFDNHSTTVQMAREVTGIALALQPWASTQGSQIVDPLHPIAQGLKDGRFGVSQRWEPSFYALHEDTSLSPGSDNSDKSDDPKKFRVIAEYIETGLPSLGVAEHGDWRAVFIGERSLTPGLLRGIAAWAGIPVWCDTNDVVQVRLPFIHLHASRGGEKSLNLPRPLAVYDLIENAWVADEAHEYRFGMSEGESRLFLVGPRAAIEGALTGAVDHDALQALFDIAAVAHTEKEEAVEQTLVPPEEPQPLEDWMPVLTEEAVALVQSYSPPATEGGDLPEEAQPAKASGRRRKKKSKKAQKTSTTPPPEDIFRAIRWRKQPSEG
jgi:hypothetical protein